MSATLKSAVPRTFKGVGMLIDWGRSRTSFSIFENNVVRFASTVSVGGDMMDKLAELFDEDNAENRPIVRGPAPRRRAV